MISVLKFNCERSIRGLWDVVKGLIAEYNQSVLANLRHLIQFCLTTCRMHFGFLKVHLATISVVFLQPENVDAVTLCEISDRS